MNFDRRRHAALLRGGAQAPGDLGAGADAELGIHPGSCAIRASAGLDLRNGQFGSDRERRLVTGVDGPAVRAIDVSAICSQAQRPARPGDRVRARLDVVVAMAGLLARVMLSLPSSSCVVSRPAGRKLACRGRMVPARRTRR